MFGQLPSAVRLSEVHLALCSGTSKAAAVVFIRIRIVIFSLENNKTTTSCARLEQAMALTLYDLLPGSALTCPYAFSN